MWDDVAVLKYVHNIFDNPFPKSATYVASASTNTLQRKWHYVGGHKRQCASTLFAGILAFEDNCYQASILSALWPSCVRKVNLTLMERSEGEACDNTHPLCLHPHPTICYSNNHHHMRNLENLNCTAKPFPYF